jgi:YidC/Oxa1 family membrane protein insertase
MQIIGNLFQTIFLTPILNILVGLYHLFLYIKVPGAFGFAVLALTILVRVALHPFFKSQIESAKKMQDLKPHLDRLSQKHKKDAKRLQQEQMKLYQEAGINPASSCLFMIIQMPIFLALYNTLSRLLTNGGTAKVIEKINTELYLPSLHIQAIDPWFFGFNLALTPGNAHVWYYYLIPVITGALQYFQVAFSVPPAPVEDKKIVKKGTDKKENTSGEFQKAMNTQMKYIFPLMIGWFSFSLPVGLSLYWNIFSIFSIIQYRKVNSK